MESTYQQIERQARDAGMNLTKLCRAAGVDRSVLTRWEEKEPKTITIYRKLIAAIPKPVDKLPTSGDEVIC